MATKISGIKGINISKSSVLKDGSKKTSANDSFRDTANGTTRDNSKNNNQSTLDSAMIKMLLGQTELMAKKTKEIEENMRRAEKKEEERQKTQKQNEIQRIKREEERQKQKNDRAIDSAYDKIDAGLVNGVLSSFLGPIGVFLGKGLNQAGVGGLTKKGVRSGIRGVGKAFSSIGKIWGKKSKEEKENESENALSVNKREMAAEPINKFKDSVTSRLDEIIKLMGGRPRGGGEGGENKKGLLDWILPFLPLLAGAISGYQPLKDFGTKFLLKKFRKILDPIIRWAAKFGGKVWDHIKGPLKKAGAKLWNFIKSPLSKAGKFLGGSLKKLGAKIMSSGIGRALKHVATSISKSGIVQGLKTLAKNITKTAGKLLKPVGKVLSKVAKPLVKVGGKILKPLTKAGGKILQKVAGKGGTKALGKSLLKKIPGVGLLSGLWFAGKRALKGDWTGAGLELASGATSLIPGVGTAASIGLDALILARDIKKDMDAEKQQKQIETQGSYDTEVPENNDYTYMQESADKQNAILDILSQIEYNLRPEVQQHLDERYLSNAQRMFDRPPEAPQYDLGLNGMVPSMNNPLGVR